MPATNANILQEHTATYFNILQHPSHIKAQSLKKHRRKMVTRSTVLDPAGELSVDQSEVSRYETAIKCTSSYE